MQAFPELIYSVIAIIGGMARHLSAYIRGDIAKISWQMLVANAFVSGFSGYMFAQTMLLVSPDWVYVAAGVGGYMGTQALDIIVDYIKRHMK